MDLQLHRKVAAMLKPNALMGQLLADYKDEVASARSLVSATFKMAHLKHLIHDHFVQEEEPGVRNWFAAPLHMLLHAALHAREVSPRLTWNFSGSRKMRAKMLLHWRFAMHHEIRVKKSCIL